jgi:hypothetical protein
MKKSALITGCIICLLLLFGVKVYADTINTIIVHHTATLDVSIAVIRKYHIEHNKWNDVGYHFLIRADGTIENGRPVSKVGAHAKGRNAHSVGIALTGNDKFTWQQKVSLGILVRKLCQQYPVQKIERHHEQCPGPGLEVEAMTKEILGTRDQIGIASHFADWNTASGKHIYPWTIGCASWFYPLGSYLKVTNLKTGKTIRCEVIDRGPSKSLVVQGRIIDLTTAAFAKICNTDVGLVRVKVEVL